MKKSILISVIASLFTIGSIAISGCGGSEQSHKDETHDHDGAHEHGEETHDHAKEEHEHGTGDEHAHEHGSHAGSGHMQHMNEVLKKLKSELGDQYDQPAPPATDEQLALGKETFIQFCATCHGEGGKGDGPIVKSLDSKPADFTDNAHSKFYSDQGRIQIIKKGIEGTPMAGWESVLNEEKIAAVYAYIRSLRSTKKPGGHGHSHKGEDHSHGSPHGGVIKSAGNYHIEMVKGEGSVSFYLLDEEEHTIPNKDIKGTAIFQFDNQTTATEKLVTEGDDHFVVQLKVAGLSFTCIVNFKVKGESINAKFQKENHGDHGHEH